MPPVKRPYKHRKSSNRSEVSSGRASSASSTASASQASRVRWTRRNSGSSLRGQSRRWVSHDAQYRPQSSISAQTSASDTTNGLDGIPERHQDEYQDIEALNEVIMAVDLTDRGAIGCAYYVARTETLYMEDVQMGDAEMVDAREFCTVEIAILSELTNF